MIKVLSKDMLVKDEIPAYAQIKDESGKPVNITDHIRMRGEGGNTVAEFVGTGDFNAAWFERQRFEVDAGRDQEPILYTPLYPEVNDPNLPQVIKVYRVGPGAVIFDEVEEGGEVKFVSVESSDYNVTIKHRGIGLEYTKDMMMYNQLWNVAIVERQAGIAVNALLNHAHLYPFIAYSYGSGNQTAASAVGSTLIEKYMRTLEDAVTNSKTDATNPRRGPYWIMCSASNFFMLSRALSPVPQQGFTEQTAELMGMIRGLIVYDGWSGRRGKKTVSYSGVTANKAYLIDVGQRDRNMGSYIKQPLTPNSGGEDVSRFVLEQTVWDIYFGNYVDVAACAEEISLPTS